MAPTVTRLILSFALLVATPVIYILGIFLADQVLDIDYDNFWLTLLVLTAGCVAGFALGWWVIWRGEVRMTTWRRRTTAAATAGSLLGACVSGATVAMAVRYDGEEIGIVFGGLFWLVFWLFGTALAWRETKGERAARLAMMGVDALPCPGCGYNLSGLRETRCPECGASFTLDQLFAAVDEQRRPLNQNP